MITFNTQYLTHNTTKKIWPVMREVNLFFIRVSNNNLKKFILLLYTHSFILTDVCDARLQRPKLKHQHGGFFDYEVEDSRRRNFKKLQYLRLTKSLIISIRTRYIFLIGGQKI